MGKRPWPLCLKRYVHILEIAGWAVEACEKCAQRAVASQGAKVISRTGFEPRQPASAAS